MSISKKTRIDDYCASSTDFSDHIELEPIDHTHI